MCLCRNAFSLAGLVLILVLAMPYPGYAQWTSINSGVSSRLVDGCFLNDSTAIFVGYDGTVIRSADYGNTWSQVAALSGVFTSISYAGGDTVYIGGNAIYRSDDGGTTWNLMSVLGFTATDIGFFNNGKGYAIQPGTSTCQWSGGSQVTDNYTIHESTDKGVTWQSAFYGYTRESRIGIINDSTAVITGRFYVVAGIHCYGYYINSTRRTTDKGNTWTTIASLGGTFGSFIDPDTGFFMVPTDMYSLYKTNNGGQNVTGSYTQVNDTRINDFMFMNTIDGYIAGMTGIHASTSGGFGWQMDYASNDTLTKLVKNSSNLVMAMGYHGAILKKQHIPSAYPDTVYRVRVSSPRFDFGFVNVDSSLNKSFQVTNTGSLPATLNLTVQPPFAIGFDTLAMSGNLSVALNTFEDTTIYVRFTPPQDQFYTDTLRINAVNMDEVKVPLTGTGYFGLSGTLSQDTLICTDTLLIGNNVIIEETAKVTICPGTYVQFLGNFSITVKGILKAIGTPSSEIYFGALDTVSLWSGISINSAVNSDKTEFAWCNLNSKCNAPLISLRKGNLEVSESFFSNRKLGQEGIELYGISSPTPFSCIIRDSKFHDGKGAAISATAPDSVFIYNNEILRNTRGVLFSFAHPGNIIDNNDIHGHIQEGIYGFGKVNIRNNRISGNGGGIFFEGEQSIIENNVVWNNSTTFTAGISAGVAGESIIRQNLIFNNTSTFGTGGLSLAPTDPSFIHAYVVNNTICNNRGGSGYRANNFYATTNTGSGLTIKVYNNIITNVTDTANNVRWLQYVNHDFRYNCINQDSINIWGANNISVPARFVSPTDSAGVMLNIGNPDWTLKQSSYCINKGDSVNITWLLNSDLAGNPRIFNNRVDIGAYEFQGYFVDEQGPPPPPPVDTVYTDMIFPNPAEDYIFVSTSMEGDCTISLWDHLGRLVLKREFRHQTELSLITLTKGVYFYRVEGVSGGETSGRIVKAR